MSNIPNPWLDDKDAMIGFVDILLGLLDLKNVDIYVTGSNSKMLSTDVMTDGIIKLGIHEIRLDNFEDL